MQFSVWYLPSLCYHFRSHTSCSPFVSFVIFCSIPRFKTKKTVFSLLFFLCCFFFLPSLRLRVFA